VLADSFRNRGRGCGAGFRVSINTSFEEKNQSHYRVYPPNHTHLLCPPFPNPRRSKKKEKYFGLAQPVNESQENLTKSKSRHPSIPHLQHTLTQSYHPSHKPHPHQPIPIPIRPPTHSFLPLPLILRRIRIRRPIIPLACRHGRATSRRRFKRGMTRTAARARIPAPGRGVGVRGEVGGGRVDGVGEGGCGGRGGYGEGG
jgi:hypothetical protein